MSVRLPESQVLAMLWEQGPLSRQEIHQLTGWRPNTVGDLAGELIRRGLLVEGEPQTGGPGRPRKPLLLESQQARIVGLAILPRRVEVGRLNLLGQRVGEPHSRETSQGQDVVGIAKRLLEQSLDDDIVAVGISATGLLDSEQRSILYSTAIPGQTSISVAPLFDAAGHLPVVFDNDMHALAARWVLTHKATPSEDVLIVHLRDGAIGAALVIDGKPNRGSVVGGNELGFTRLPVDGEMVCLEGIFNSDFLGRQHPGSDSSSLAELIAKYDEHHPKLQQIVQLLSIGIANAINLIRPHRLVLASSFGKHASFTDGLLSEMRRYILEPLEARLEVQWWDDLLDAHAENAGWLGLAYLYQRSFWPAIETPELATTRST